MLCCYPIALSPFYSIFFGLIPPVHHQGYFNNHVHCYTIIVHHFYTIIAYNCYRVVLKKHALSVVFFFTATRLHQLRRSCRFPMSLRWPRSRPRGAPSTMVASWPGAQTNAKGFADISCWVFLKLYPIFICSILLYRIVTNF